MWITVDIDNTIANTNLALVRKFGISLKKYPAPEVPPGFFATVEGLRLLQNVELFPYADTALDILNDLGYRVAYLSSRPAGSLFVTQRWLRENNCPPGEVRLGLPPAGGKQEFIRELKPVAVFEDDPAVIRPLFDLYPPATLWLKNWPYNQPAKGGVSRSGAGRVVRFGSWDEVCQAITASNPFLAAARRREE